MSEWIVENERLKVSVSQLKERLDVLEKKIPSGGGMKIIDPVTEKMLIARQLEKQDRKYSGRKDERITRLREKHGAL